MSLLSNTIVILIAVLHLYILWLEIFQWESRGPKVFRNFPKEMFAQTKTMAANQGLYNGFLSAGLVWSLFIQNPDWQLNVALCFLLFVLVAGVFGAFTASKKILYIQAVPAALGIASLFLT